MFVFEQKALKEVLRASPRSCISRVWGHISVWFQLELSNSRCTSGASCLQLLGNSCVSCLVHGIWLVGSKGSLRMALPGEVSRLTPCWVPVASLGEESSCIWGTFLIRQSLSPAHQILPKDLCVSAGLRAKFWVPWPITKWSNTHFCRIEGLRQNSLQSQSPAQHPDLPHSAPSVGWSLSWGDATNLW